MSSIAEVSRKTGLSADTLRYYERAGAIPPVTRTPSGIRDYTEEDIAWVDLAKCMRSAGLPIEVLVEYLKLYRQGASTMDARLKLLEEQRRVLDVQQKAIQATIDRLDYKIDGYRCAMEAGKQQWEPPTRESKPGAEFYSCC